MANDARAGTDSGTISRTKIWKCVAPSILADSMSDDGSDPAYGVGAAIELGGLQLRAEYEMFDISDVDDLYMLSAGIAFSF